MLNGIASIAWAIAATLCAICLITFFLLDSKKKTRLENEKNDLENKLKTASENLEKSLDNDPENLIEHSRLRGIVQRLQLKIDAIERKR